MNNPTFKNLTQCVIKVIWCKLFNWFKCCSNEYGVLNTQLALNWVVSGMWKHTDGNVSITSFQPEHTFTLRLLWRQFDVFDRLLFDTWQPQSLSLSVHLLPWWTGLVFFMCVIVYVCVARGYFLFRAEVKTPFWCSPGLCLAGWRTATEYWS